MKFSPLSLFRPLAFSGLLTSVLALDLLVLGSLAQDLLAQDSSGLSPQEEKNHRINLYDQAEKAFLDGERLLADRDYDRAAERYEFVLDTVPDSGIARPIYQRAEIGLAAAKSGQAEAKLRQNNFSDAASLWQDAILLDPTNPLYPEKLDALKRAQEAYQEKTMDPEGTEGNPAVTTEFREKVASVAKLLFQGDRYFQTGQYEKAETTYEKALILDPYNKAARSRMDRMERYRLQGASLRHEEYEQEVMNQVNEQWEEKPNLDIISGGPAVAVASNPSDHGKILHKLQTLKLDKVDFDRLDIEQVINILQEKSKEVDPEHEGINFVLRLTSSPDVPTTTPQVTSPGTPTSTTAANLSGTTTPLPDASKQVKRSVSFTDGENISLYDLLTYITEETNLQFTVEDYAVYIRPAVDNGDFISVRTFLAPPNLFPGNEIRTSDTGTDQDATQGASGFSQGFTNASFVKRDVVNDLKNLGIKFDVPGSTATLLPGTGRLVVRDTPEQLDLIAGLIDQLSVEQPQVEIQAKIAEFNQDAFKGVTVNSLLSADPSLGSGNTFSGEPAGTYQVGLAAGTALRNSLYSTSNNGGLNGGISQDAIGALIQANSGINTAINNPSSLFLGGIIGKRGFGLLLELINNTKGVSLLSAPSVTTQNKLKASIDVVQEFPYPTAFQAPKLADNQFVVESPAGLAFAEVALPATVSDFETKELGVSLEVTPTTYNDKRIDLDISKAQVVDFDGFINYGENITSINSTEQTTPTVLTNDYVNQPIFEYRSMQTRLQVLDGQTAVLGGLMREDTQEINDKVPIFGDLPIVGRLFQSKVTERTKKNLIFFVTANLVRSDGKPHFMKTTSLEPAPSSQDSPSSPEASDIGAAVSLPPLPDSIAH